MVCPVAALLAEGNLEQAWADASPDIKGKVIDEIFSVIVRPIPKGHKGPGFNPDYVRIVWRHQ